MKSYCNCGPESTFLCWKIYLLHWFINHFLTLVLVTLTVFRTQTELRLTGESLVWPQTESTGQIQIDGGAIWKVRGSPKLLQFIRLNLGTKFHPSHSINFCQNHKCQSHGNVDGKVRGSPKSLGFILWGPWKGVIHIISWQSIPNLKDISAWTKVVGWLTIIPLLELHLYHGWKSHIPSVSD